MRARESDGRAFERFDLGHALSRGGLKDAPRSLADVWEDACIDGLIGHEPGTGKVILSVAGHEFLSRSVAAGAGTPDEPASTV